MSMCVFVWYSTLKLNRLESDPIKAHMTYSFVRLLCAANGRVQQEPDASGAMWNSDRMQCEMELISG